MQLLIENGADVNAVSKAGITPWLAASGYGDRLGGVLFNKARRALLVSTARIRSSAIRVMAQNSAGERNGSGIRF